MGFRYGLDYIDSKWKAHQMIMESVAKGLPALVVNPTFMFGAYDTAPNTGKMILAVYNNKIPGCTNGGRNYICVKDAAAGIANALEKGRVGESYIIGNENLSYKEIFAKIASVIDVDPPRNQLPGWMLLAFGRIASMTSRITGKQPTLSYAMAKIACDEQYYSSQKAVRDLDLPQTPVEVGISEAFNWLKSNGYIH
jgi:dihydroflavonol-4-reductase